MSAYISKRIWNLLKSKTSGFTTSRSDRSFQTEQDGHSGPKDEGQAEAYETEEGRHLKALELKGSPDFSEVKKAYHRLSREYHPDGFTDEADKLKIATDVQQQLNEAFRYFKEKMK